MLLSGVLLTGAGVVFAISNSFTLPHFLSESPVDYAAFVFLCGVVTVACGGVGLCWGSLKLF